MDAFFTSVEQRENPSLKGKPVIVGGDPHGRGVVAGASYEVRKFGVHSAMSCAKALRLCPQAIFVRPNIALYVKVSEQIREIFHSATPLVEPLSLDEAYLDVTENLLGLPLARDVALYIKERIRQELNLTASAGVAPNKFLAKVASDFRKPDGLVVIAPEKALAFIEKLPIEKIWGVGPVTAGKLHALGIVTAGDIRRTSVAELEQAVGSYGEFLHGLANGIDPRAVETETESKSTGAETTFEHDLTDFTLLEETIVELSDEVSASLKQMQRPGKTITLKVRYSDFSTITRSQTLPVHVDEVEAIAKVASLLLREKTEAGVRPIRLLGVSVSGLLQADEPEQLWLPFPAPFHPWE